MKKEFLNLALMDVTATMDNNLEESSDEETSDEEGGVDYWNDLKPPATRVIVEHKALKDLIDPKLPPCPKCNFKTELTFETLTIATSCSIQCLSHKCGYIEALKSHRYDRGPDGKSTVTVGNFAPRNG